MVKEGVVLMLERPQGRSAGVYAINEDYETWGRFSVKERRLAALYDHFGPGAAGELKRPSALVEPGYVYYARANDVVKIGFSRDPWARVSSMRTSSPSLKLVAVEPGTLATEAARHQEFAEWRIEDGREWFTWSEVIERHASELRWGPSLDG